MSQTAQRGSHQEDMQPVGVIRQAVEVVQGRHPRRLVTPQACAIGMQVPWQRHGAYRQPGARGGGVAGAHGVEQALLLVEQSLDGMRGAVGLWTSIGWGGGG
jgi:hypothetical protein